MTSIATTSRKCGIDYGTCSFIDRPFELLRMQNECVDKCPAAFKVNMQIKASPTCGRRVLFILMILMASAILATRFLLSINPRDLQQVLILKLTCLAD